MRCLLATNIPMDRLGSDNSSMNFSNIPRNHKVHFNVSSPRKLGQPWGTFTTEFSPEFDGPSYDDEEPRGNPVVAANKVSAVSTTNVWSTVLLARLRFKPDVLEPTSM